MQTSSYYKCNLYYLIYDRSIFITHFNRQTDRNLIVAIKIIKFLDDHSQPLQLHNADKTQ